MTQTDVFERPPHPGYGIPHIPLTVTPVQSNRRPDQVVAFIGHQLCFFEKNSPLPPVGREVEVMLTRPLFHRYTRHDAPPTHKPSIGDNGEEIYGFNWNKLLAIMVRVVTEDYQLIPINGFECSGTMCSTTASGIGTDVFRHYSLQEILKEKVFSRELYTLTPGRTHVREASNVNAGRTWKIPFTPLTPTNVYVEKARVAERGNYLRIEGLTRIEDAGYRGAVRV